MYELRFGTGGWRAVIGQDFICDNIRRVTQAVCDMLAEDGQTDRPVMVGYDRRFLSYDAARWISEVLCANGLRALFMNRTAPTPLVMHTVKTRGLHCGLQVTASHNPSNYNGIKLIVGEGRDAPLETTARIELLVRKAALEGCAPKAMSFDVAVKEGLVECLKNPFNRFIDDIEAKMDMQIIRNRGLRILFDPMHGSGTYPLMVLLYTARCTIDLIHVDRDAYFGGYTPAPSELSLHELRQKVSTRGYDLGIAFDGDGDRLGIIDSNGRYITANEILVLLYYYLHEYKGWKGPVVRNMSTTHMLDALATSFGETCYEVPVGFKHISEKMDEVDAVLGGESSGGLTVRGHIHGKDSIYAAVLFVEAVSALMKSPTDILDELYARYGRFEMVEESLPLTPDEMSRARKLVMEDRALPDFDAEIERVSYLDGCKVYFANGAFAVCRFSGTEPLLRLCAEAPLRVQAERSVEAFKRCVAGATREEAALRP